MKHTGKVITLFVILSLVGTFFVTQGRIANAQANDNRILELRNEIAELTRRAEQYRGTVISKQKEANTLARQISIINSEIRRLETDIVITGVELETTNLEVGDIQNQIYLATDEIELKKETIKRLVVQMYEKEHDNIVTILLKSDKLSDFTDQAEQAQRLNNSLSISLSDIKNQKIYLVNQKDTLNQKKSELETLTVQQSVQQRSLSYSRVNKSSLLEDTKGEEVVYQNLLNNVEAQKAAFFAQLQDLEREAKTTGSLITHVTATSIPKKGTVYFQWPYDKYYFTQGYGYTSYARRSGAYGGAGHNGIDIVSGYGSAIRPIGEGIVLTGGFNNGFGNWIAIQHDNSMVSVYAHMNTAPNLTNGTPVSRSSVIGYEGSTGNSTGSHVHMSLYKDFFTYVRASSGQLYFNYYEGTVNPLDFMPKR